MEPLILIGLEYNPNNGELKCMGIPNNLVLAFGILEAAKSVVSQNMNKSKTPSIISPAHPNLTLI